MRPNCNSVTMVTGRCSIQVAMELAYLCCARQHDILTLKKDQLMESGIYIKQGKTGKKQIKGWSGRLRKVIKMAESLPNKSGIPGLYVIHQQNGGNIPETGLTAAGRQPER